MYGKQREKRRRSALLRRRRRNSREPEGGEFRYESSGIKFNARKSEEEVYARQCCEQGNGFDTVVASPYPPSARSPALANYQRRASLLDSAISARKDEGEAKKGERERKTGGGRDVSSEDQTTSRRAARCAPKTPGQTLGRLDETAKRHETEGKRKWQRDLSGGRASLFLSPTSSAR